MTRTATTRLLVGAITAGLILCGSASPIALQSPDPRPQQAAPQTSSLAFTKDLAPIIFAHCSVCHRPDGPAPFSLLTYADVKGRAGRIAAATKSRAMPPWKPEPGYGEFQGDRRLSDDQIALIQRWINEGAIEGDAEALPPVPRWTEGWQLGEPDLIVKMSQPYTLPAEGADVFRNFVIPIPIPARRYVRAWEFRPGNIKVVHHATMQLDPTRSSRRLDEQDPEPGYEGLIAHSAQSPEGYFLGWTPGQTPYPAPDERAWPLEKDSDLVLMLHLRPSGKKETIQASVGLYFSNAPRLRIPAMLRLGRQNIDIPAGEKHYTITDSYTLPVDVDVYSVQPHAHYLAKEMKGFAALPDGTTKWLIYIREWDFNWQDLYQFATPVPLPAGTTVVMQYTYDNSADNPRNPHRPPRRVTYGQRTSDEMGDLWLQVLSRNDTDLAVLTRGLRAKVLHENILGYEVMLQADPDNVGMHDDLALLYAEAGNLEQATAQFAESLRIRPESAAAHYNLGTALLDQGRRDAADSYLRKALQIKPDYASAHVNLGIVLQSEAKLEEAAGHYWQAIQIAPDNAEAHNNFGAVLQLQGKFDDAIGHYREAVRIQADYAEAHYNVAVALRSQGKIEDAIPHYRQAIRSKPDWPAALIELAWILATSADSRSRQPEEALQLAERGVKLMAPQTAAVLDVLAATLAAAGRFEQAVTTAQAALTLATAGHDEGAAARIRERLDLYRQHRPYREPQ